MKRFATFETSSHFKFFDDFASKASISSDVVVVVVALLLVVVVLRFLLRVFVLSFVFLHAVIKGGTDGDDDFDEQHFFVARVVAVVKVVIITRRDRFLENLSLSSFSSQTKKKATRRKSALSKEREREKAARFGSGRDAFRAKTKVCYSMSARVKKVSFFEKISLFFDSFRLSCQSLFFQDEFQSFSVFQDEFFRTSFCFFDQQEKRKKEQTVCHKTTNRRQQQRERERETTNKPFVASAKKEKRRDEDEVFRGLSFDDASSNSFCFRATKR